MLVHAYVCLPWQAFALLALALSSDCAPPRYVNICQTLLWPDSINHIYIGRGCAVFTSLDFQTQPILRMSLCLLALSKSQAAHGYR